MERSRILLEQLNQIQKLAMHLEAQIRQQPHCRALAQKIICSLQNTISWAEEQQPDRFHASVNSQFSFQAHKPNAKPRKRKAENWTCQVTVDLETQLAPGDGFSWRKYGQKDILGAKHPRAYYRCTRQKSHGCRAKKQVQRSDKDSTILDVTYQRKHTCLHTEQEHLDSRNQMQILQYDQTQHQLSCIQAGVPDTAESMGVLQIQESSSSFSFPSTSMGLVKPGMEDFWDASIQENYDKSISPLAYVPLNIEESNYFVFPQSELTHTATSVTNSPVVDMEFARQQEETETNFLLDTCNFLLN